MTRKEMLLVSLAEECAEIQQKVSKALRFGLGSHPPDSDEPNAEGIIRETADFLGVLEMLQTEKQLGEIDPERVKAKKAKIEKYLNYSLTAGTLTRDPSKDPNAEHCRIGIPYIMCGVFEENCEGCKHCPNYIKDPRFAD